MEMFGVLVIWQKPRRSQIAPLGTARAPKPSNMRALGPLHTPRGLTAKKRGERHSTGKIALCPPLPSLPEKNDFLSSLLFTVFLVVVRRLWCCIIFLSKCNSDAERPSWVLFFGGALQAPKKKVYFGGCGGFWGWGGEGFGGPVARPPQEVRG